MAEPIDIGAEYYRVDLWSLQQARDGLADAIAKGLPFSTQMYREQVARLEESIAKVAWKYEKPENMQ